MACVAEGGESCLTSGDRREPEDKYVYIKTSSPSLGFAERGGRGKMWWGRYSSGSFQSPEVKHNSPPSATSEHNPLTSITRLNINVYYTIETLDTRPTMADAMVHKPHKIGIYQPLLSLKPNKLQR